jgi:hypothetical protein
MYDHVRWVRDKQRRKSSALAAQLKPVLSPHLSFPFILGNFALLD